MSQQTLPQKKALLFSAGFHVVVLILLICSYEFSAPMLVVSNNDPKVVNAIALKDSPLIAPPTKVVEDKPVAKPVLPQPEPPKPLPETVAATKPAASAEPAIQAPAEKKLALSNEHKKPLPDKPQKTLAKKELSKQLLADLEDELAKQSKAKQKKLKNKFSQALKAQSEKALDQLMKEQSHTAAASERSQHMQGIIDKYKAQIIQAIGQQWVVPSHVNKRLYCELLIHLAPGGVVLDVQVTKSSGDLSLDRSARSAVFKASPLPVPDDIYSFEPFRQFVLKVKPENVLENKGEQGFWIG